MSLRDIRKCPSWAPGRDLCADQLLGLEAYVLARASFIDDSFGVAEFNFTTDLHVDDAANIQLGRRDSKLCFRISRLQGITPGGEPVLVEPDENLVTPHVTIDLSSPDLSSPPLVDLRVRVNDRPADFANNKKVVPKLTALAEIVQEKDDRPNDASELYVGRYQLIVDDGKIRFSLKGIPPVMRLAALQPLVSEWREWIRPLERRIADVFDGVQSAWASGSCPAGVVAQVERLAVSWPILSIRGLALRLCEINALLTATPGRAPEPLLALPKIDCNSPDLPSKLADLLSSQPQAETPPQKHEPEPVREHKADGRRRLATPEDVMFYRSGDGIGCKFIKQFTRRKFILRIRTSQATAITAWTGMGDRAGLVPPSNFANDEAEYIFNLKRTVESNEIWKFVGQGMPTNPGDYELYCEDPT